MVFCEVMNGLGIWPDLDMIRISFDSRMGLDLGLQLWSSCSTRGSVRISKGFQNRNTSPASYVTRPPSHSYKSWFRSEIRTVSIAKK